MCDTLSASSSSTMGHRVLMGRDGEIKKDYQSGFAFLEHSFSPSEKVLGDLDFLTYFALALFDILAVLTHLFFCYTTACPFTAPHSA